MWCKEVRILAIVSLFPICQAQGEKRGSILALTSARLSPMTTAITHFEKEFFKKRTGSLSVTVRTRDDGAFQYFSDLLTTVLTATSELKVQVQVTGYTREPKNFDFYNILMIDSYRALADLDPGWHAQYNDFSEYYLIALHPISSRVHLMSELKQIFEYCWRYYIINVDVLVELNATDVELYTYFPFSRHHCKSVMLKQLNREKTIIKLSSSALFPDKGGYFYGCKLRAVLWNVPPYVELPEHDQAELQFGGMEGRLLHLLATQLNFTLDYIVPPRNEQRGLVMANGTLTGAIKLLADKTGDFSLGSFRHTLERATILSSSISFYQTTQVLAVLEKREPWSSFEILTYPFNINVWCLLTAFYLLPILLAFILHRLRLQALQQLYGVSNAQQVVFIWTGILLAQSARPIPTSHFARYIFTMWLILTLVLHSSYQALLYDFFHTHKTIALPTTLEELVQRKYKLVVNEATADALSGIKAGRNSKIELLVLDIIDTGSLTVLEENPQKHFAACTPRDFVNYYVIKEKKFGVFKILNDDVYSQHISVFFTKHSYMQIPVNNILGKLRDSGIIDYWSLLNIGIIKGIKEEQRAEKSSLTLIQLYGIFEVQAWLWCIALAVFLVECLLRNKIRP